MTLLGKGDAPDGVQGFLLQALDPPHLLSITNAVSLLQAINCLDEHEAVTALGTYLPPPSPCHPHFTPSPPPLLASPYPYSYPYSYPYPNLNLPSPLPQHHPPL